MSTFTAGDGKRYFKDSQGNFREVNVSTDLGVPSTPTKEQNQIKATKSIAGTSRGGYGGSAGGNACDDPAYIARFNPTMRGTDGEAVEHAGNRNHPLNSSVGWLCDRPFRPTRLPEEIVAEQIALGDYPAEVFSARITKTPSEVALEKYQEAADRIAQLQATVAGPAAAELAEEEPIA